MKIVVVDWDITYPPNSGKRLRTLNLMLQLASRHDITYFSRGNGETTAGRQARQYLNDRGIGTIFTNHPLPEKSSLTYYRRLAAHFWADDPLAVAAHRSVPFAGALQDYARQHQVDLWQLEWTPYVHMLPKISSLRSLIIAHNVDSLIWQRYCQTERHPLMRHLFKSQWRKFIKFERAAFNRASGVVAVSRQDAALLQSDFGVEHVDVVDNGVDLDYFHVGTVERDPHELLFLGSLDWRPNLDAVRLLLDDIFPRVQGQEPRTKLTIVGRNPPNWLAARIASQPNIDLQANVPDVRPYLTRAGMMVVPLRIGGGSRLKILEALACALPVVATSVAAEGLRLKSGRDLRIADGAEEMAEGVVDWIRQPQHAAVAARRGREVVIDQYGWGKLAEQLEAVWEKTAAHREVVGQK